MDIYEKAVVEAEKSKTIRVFAPVGLWAVEKEKEDWIQTICKSVDKKREFIFGGSRDSKNHDLLSRRVKQMTASNVEVLEIPIQDGYDYGFIIFDNIMILATHNGYEELTDCMAINSYKQMFDSTKQIVALSQTHYEHLLLKLEKEVISLKEVVTKIYDENISS